MNRVISILEKVGAEGLIEQLCRENGFLGLVRPHIIELSLAKAEVRVNTTRQTVDLHQNFHEAALATIADAVGSLMLEATVPDGAKWSKIGISVDFIFAVQNELHAVAVGDKVDWTKATDQVVPIELRDARGEVVTRAQLRVFVTPAK